jgi:hypothetical protein
MTNIEKLLFSNFLFNLTVKEIIASKIVTEKVSKQKLPLFT